jgi:hypothetical protein
MEDTDQAAFDPAYRIETLRDLVDPTGGVYRLEGLFVGIVDFENPTVASPERSDPGDFLATRADDSFEAVMAYYHLDRIQRYLRSLGYDGAGADSIVETPLRVDVHAFDGDDNSRYDPPPLHRLAFGDGCVDDAEDADVLIHEYGHAVEFSQVPNWGYPSGYMGAMAEGFSDYWAESHAARSGIVFDLGQVFDWDRNRREGACRWAGRRTDNGAVVPDSLRPLTSGNIYANSRIWSGALWDIHQAIGGDASDRAVLEGHFFLNGTAPSSTFEDAAWAILQADEELTGGANALGIFGAFRDRGIFTEENTAPPVLLYAAHPETLYSGTAVACSLSLSSQVPIRSVRVVSGAAPDADTLDLAPAGEGFFAGELPIGSGSDSVAYYYEVIDALDRVLRLPEGRYTTRIVVDTEAPTIAHTPLRDYLESELPIPVSATIRDNGSVDPESVLVTYTFTALGGAAASGSFPLSPGAADSVFEGVFPEGPGRIGSFAYRITAVDSSPLRNRASSPETGLHTFDVVATASRLVVRGPNPFGAEVSFELSLAQASEVRFFIYDVSGRLVRRVADERFERGIRPLVWDGKNEEGRRAAPGTYLYRLEATGIEKSGVVVLLR